MELCPALGIAHPGRQGLAVDAHGRGATRRRGREQVTAPLSPDRVSAFAPVADVRRDADAAICNDRATTRAAAGRPRARAATGWAARRWRRSTASSATTRPDLDDPDALRALLRRRAGAASATGLLLAYHDRSRRRAVRRRSARWRSRRAAGVDASTLDGRGRRSARGAVRRGTGRGAAGARRATLRRGAARARAHGPVASCARASARPSPTTRLAIRHRRPRRLLRRGARRRCTAPGRRLTYALQRLRDNPDVRDRGVRRGCSTRTIRGSRSALTFDPRDDVAAPFVAGGARPRDGDPARAGHQRPGRDGGGVRPRRASRRVDVHMTDLLAGRRRLDGLSRASSPAAGSPTATCSAPARAGRSRSCSTRARATSSRRSSRARDTFALGVCNGCQMMSQLNEIIPGAAHWPHFVRNRSEQFEARFVHGRGPCRRRRCSSAAWQAAASPIAAAHGEGLRGVRGRRRRLAAARPLVALRFVDNHGPPTERYPFNPNGSPRGHHRAHHGRRPRHDPDAAPRARVPRGADVVAPARRWGEDGAVDADVPQRAGRTRLKRGAVPARPAPASPSVASEATHVSDGLLNRRRHAGRASDRLRPPERGAASATFSSAPTATSGPRPACAATSAGSRSVPAPTCRTPACCTRFPGTTR